MRRFLAILMSVFVCSAVFAQTTRVRGTVRTAEGEPIAFASVYFPDTTTGILTDENGVYALETRDPVSKLTASIIGYKEQTKPVNPGAYNSIDFILEADLISIQQVTVRPGDNPAFPILDSVIRHRPVHDMDSFESYQCDTYSKMEFGLTNFKPQFRSKRLQRNFGFIFDYIDTAALTGRPYLPAIISETTSKRFHTADATGTREEIIANRVSGFERTEYIAEFTGQMQTDFNFYENYLTFFNVRFASPLSTSGRTFYKYFLVDSTRIDGRKTYKIRFHPKTKATPVLDGEINIDSASYALRSASARMPKGVNVNWIKHLQLESEHVPVDSVHWFRYRDHLSGEVSITRADSSRLISFLGRREVYYSNPQIDCPVPKAKELDDKDENPYERNEEYWDTNRPYQLSDRERQIYEMVDSVQHTPLYHNVYTVINTILSGYYNTKYIGFGPYLKLLSFNNIEKVRVQLGARTTKDMSRTVRLSGYAGYGFKDTRVKGGGEIEIMMSHFKFRKLTLAGYHDLLQLSSGNTRIHNFLTSALSQGGQRMSMVNSGFAKYEHEWVKGINTTLKASYQQIFSNEYVPMFSPIVGHVNYVHNPMVSASFRFTKGEKLLRQVFETRTLGMKYPIATFTFTGGFPKVSTQHYNYFGVDMDIHYRPKVAPLGYLDITLQGGAIFGKVPYLMLDLARANRSYVYDMYAFSCMDFYEFASDRYLALFYEHHMNGAILGLIPLLKKLQMREVLLCKCYWGTLTKKNNGIDYPLEVPLMFPNVTKVAHTPYVELGFGIENILHILRIDCVWRVTHRDSAPKNVFGRNFTINANINLTF